MSDYRPPYDPLLNPKGERPALVVGRVEQLSDEGRVIAPQTITYHNLEEVTSAADLVRQLRRASKKGAICLVSPQWLRRVADLVETLERNGGCL